MYSQIILKQSVWGPYNRSGPYNGCFSESIAGSCLSGFSHWHSFPVGNCLCRRWVLLSTLATDCQCWKVICIFKYQGSRHMKNKSWAQKSTEMVELIRSWSQIMSIPVDLERARLPVASAITAGCVWCTTKAHAHDRVWKKHKWVSGDEQHMSGCWSTDTYLSKWEEARNTSHLVSNHYCDLCDLKWQQR